MVSGKAFSSSIFLGLPVLIFIFTITCFVPQTSGLADIFPDSAFPGGLEEAKYDVNPRIERSVLEGSNGGNSSLILAAERTRRKDPLDDLKYYTGGWNISNKHYFASAGFSASPLLLAAVIWFVGCGLCLLFACLCFCCCGRQTYGYSRTAYALSLLLLLLFTVAAIVGSVVLYTGQGKFHDTTSDMLKYVVAQSDSTVNNLRNVSDYLAAAKEVKIDNIALPSGVQKNIDQVDAKITSAANTLESETEKNRNHIVDILETVRKILIIVAAVMLVVAVLGFLFSVLGLGFLVYILVFLGWILVAVTLILSGIFLALYNATGDTCLAMDQWVKNPAAHTALDDILPCVDVSTAQEILSQSKTVTFQLVGVVDGIINNVSNVNFPPSAGPLYYNQSGPLVPRLCNPFNPDNTDRKCTSGEVDLSNATQVWSRYVCQVSKNNVCTNVGRLTPSMYQQMSSAVNVSYGLNHYGPFLSDLLDCTFVRDTFTTIERDHCGGLKRYSKWVHIGLTLVAAAVALSLIFWVVYARERRHRKYTKLVDARSTQESFDGKQQYRSSTNL
ncbi:OLC1v1014625C1 [Oldenlandia corymbosa var. corymbosa]|uniref:OLC1v1014625C1 n=1 Tax=Oldenlandia corymbosa var. corymbosa TaxID=529605 RepID=A0AAV1E4F8_OLDCO|nr:OLC1v1014625C1 [Oldenlandia corymbosa var. corymbosa]